MDETQFRQKALEALEQIPVGFLDHLENVEIIVMDFAEPEVLKSLNISSKWNLLGLYVGNPINERSFFQTNLLPDRIYLYRLPILRTCADEKDVVRAVGSVILHEIGHHFGFNDEELFEMSGQTS